MSDEKVNAPPIPLPEFDPWEQLRFARDRIRELEAALAQYETLKQVVRWILRPDDRGPIFDKLGEGSIDGGDIQDVYEKFGILIPITVTEPCCENCQCAEWDDFPQTCYRLADWMKKEAALEEPEQ